MAPDILGPQQHRDHLNSMVAKNDKTLFDSLQYSYLDGAFNGRVFIVYKAAGIANGVPNPPRILTRIKVLDFESNAEYGSDVEIEDITTGERRWIGHIPERVCGYDIFMSVPPVLQLNWCANMEEDRVKHTLIYGVIIRSHSHSDHCEAGKTYCLTPKRFKALYPNVDVRLN